MAGSRWKEKRKRRRARIIRYYSRYALVLLTGVIVVSSVYFTAKSHSINPSADISTAPVETLSSIQESALSSTVPAAPSQESVTPLTEISPSVSESIIASVETFTVSTTEESTAVPSFQGPAVLDGPVKDMIRQALLYVQYGCGYSLTDRVGANGSFDCSGFVAFLLSVCYGWSDSYNHGDPWTTAQWRSFGAGLQIGQTINFGSQTYVVAMKDTEDYLTAWSVPGSIVVQYSPINRPDKTMGHISVALGNIPYQSTAEIISYISETYGVDLNGTTSTGLPMVYDQYGPAAGHTAWKVNAQSVANCVIVDNNFASDPSWIEPISIVFQPIY